MRHFKALTILVTATGSIATNDAQNNLCSSLSTIHVTTPNSPIAEIVYGAGHDAAPTSTDKLPVSKGSGFLNTDAAATLTDFLGTTQVISIVQASKSPGQESSEIKDKGPYSFSENNGTTTWLGKTPPSSISFNVATSYVTIEPLPVNTAALDTEVATSSGFLIISSTLGYHKKCPAKITTGEEEKLVDPTISSGKYFTGPGAGGWNATTFATVKSRLIATASGVGYVQDKHPTITGTIHHEHHVTGKTLHGLIARDVGDIVYATVDGVVVSWTNSYDGTSSTTSDPVDTRPASPSHVESAGPSDSNAFPSTPSTTLAIYPWDLSPEPITTSTTEFSMILAPTPRFLNSSSTTSISSIVTAKPSSCSEVSASFIVNFDDLPHFDITSSPDDTDVPPIFNPYRKLYWQDHFGYVPPPSDPFPPHSPPQLAVYRASKGLATGSPDAGLEMTGEIGAGPRASDSAYWIDAHSMWFGCSIGNVDSKHNNCGVTINGYTSEFNGISVSQTLDLTPCAGSATCALTQVTLNDNFVGLSGLQILATVLGQPVDYYMDDLELSWSNNSCAAQHERASAH